MKNNKFIIPLLLLGLVACGGGSTSNDNGSNPSSEPTSESTSIYSSEEEIISSEFVSEIESEETSSETNVSIDIGSSENFSEEISEFESIDLPTSEEDPTPVVNNYVYFNLNGAVDWTSVYLYSWSDAGDVFGAWPGTQMSYDEATGYYAYNIGELDNINVIFNNNEGAQTADLVYNSEKPVFQLNEIGVTTGVWTAVGEKVEIEKPIVPENPNYIYLNLNGAVEWSSVYVYSWTDAGDAFGAWPGAQMSYDEATGYYAYNIGALDNINVIFNNNEGAQTADLVYSSEKPVYQFNASGVATGVWTAVGEVVEIEKPIIPEDPNYIYFNLNGAVEWTSVYVYSWSDAGDAFGAWPGAQMSYDEATGYYAYNIGALDNINVIFNNNEGAQTADLVYSSEKPVYQFNASGVATGVWTAVGEVVEIEKPIIPEDPNYIYFNLNGAVEWTSVYVYSWSDAGDAFGAWPGAQMSYDEETGYYAYNAGALDNANIIFNNNEGSQTADLVYSSERPVFQFNTSGVTTGIWTVVGEKVDMITPEPEVPTVEYYLYGSFNNWSTSNPFVLGEDGQYKVTVEFEDGASFKFADAKWGNEISTLNGEAAANFSGGNGSNLVCNVPGEYTFTYDVAANTVSVVCNKVNVSDVEVIIDYYILGGMNSWSPTDKFEHVGEYTYEITIELESGTEFKFAKSDWSGEVSTVSGEAAANFSGGNGSNLVCDVTGTYTFTYNHQTKTVTVVEASTGGEVVPEEPETPVEPLPTSNIVYFDLNDQASWETVYIYTWEDNSSGTWPGTPMTYNEESGYYEYDLGDVSSINVIFHNNAGAQTSDLVYNSEAPLFTLNGAGGFGGVWTLVGEDVEEVEKQNNYVYVDLNGKVSWSTVYVYTWSGANTGAWPGTAMEYDAETGLYYFEIGNVESCSIIFNNNSGAQTADLTYSSATPVFTFTSSSNGTWSTLA